MKYSRRGLFSLFARPLQSQAATARAVIASVAQSPRGPATVSDATASTVNRVAIIQGRHCLALTSFCAVCVERCPVPGAMISNRGLPMVVGEVCTGCAVCHEVCPAPTNAILMLPRRRPPLSPPSPA